MIEKLLEGKCFKVSSIVFKLLKLIRVNAKLIEGTYWVWERDEGEPWAYAHWWVEIKDTYIIDLTLGQFNQWSRKRLPTFYVGRMTEDYQR